MATLTTEIKNQKKKLAEPETFGGKAFSSALNSSASAGMPLFLQKANGAAKEDHEKKGDAKTDEAKSDEAKPDHNARSIIQQQSGEKQSLLESSAAKNEEKKKEPEPSAARPQRSPDEIKLKGKVTPAAPAEQKAPEKEAAPEPGRLESEKPKKDSATTPLMGAERPPSSPKEQAQAFSNVEKKADRLAKSKKPGFTESVEITTAEAAGTNGTGKTKSGIVSEPAAAASGPAKSERAGAVIKDSFKAAKVAKADGVKPEGEAGAVGEAETGKEAEPGAAGPEAAAITEDAKGEGEGGKDTTSGEQVASVAGKGVGLEPAAEGAGAGIADLFESASTINSLASSEIHFAPTEQEKSGDPDFVKVGQEQRFASEAVATSFVSRNAGQLQSVLAFGQTAPARITSAADAAKMSIDAAIAQNSAAITDHFAAVRMKAKRAAGGARSFITKQYESALPVIHGATEKAEKAIDKTHLSALKEVVDSKTTQLTEIDRLYAEGKGKFEAAGVKVGQEAIKITKDRSSYYLRQKIAGDDSVLDGPLTNDRMDAMSSAVLQVGTSYDTSLVEEAKKQAEKSQEGKSKDISQVLNATIDSTRALEDARKGAIEGLKKEEDNAIKTANETKDSLIKSVNGNLYTTLKAIAGLEATELAKLTTYGERQKMSIDRDANLASASITQGVAQAAGALGAGLSDFAASAAQTEAPDQGALMGLMLEAQGQFDAQSATMMGQLETGVQSSEAGIADGGAQSVEAFAALSDEAMKQATATGDSFAQSMSGVIQSASTSFSQMKSNHTKTTEKSSADAEAEFEKAKKAIKDLFDSINKGLTEGFKTASDEFEKGLREQGLEKGIDSDMDKYAEEARKQVQPRWKSALKILLVIAVVVVVALVAGPAVIGAVGALATGLGASAGVAAGIGTVVGGALVGAASGAVIQVGNNVIDGETTFAGITKGVGTAMAVGAIGGALGGLGSVAGKAALGSKFISGMVTSNVGKIVVEQGINLLGDVTGNVLGDVWAGNPITWQGVLQGAAIGLGMAGAMGGMGKLGQMAKSGKLGTGKLAGLGKKLGGVTEGIEGISEKWKAKGESIGGAVGAKIKTKIEGTFGGKPAAPTVEAPVTKPTAHAPEAGAPELPTTKPAVEEPAAPKAAAESPQPAGAKGPAAPEAAAPKPAPEQPAPAKPKTEAPEAQPKPKAENEPPKSPKDEELLQETGPKKSTDLTDKEIEAELEMVAKAEPKPISEGDYVAEVDMGNGHKWKKNKNGTWCRHSAGNELCSIPSVEPKKTGPAAEEKPKSEVEPETEAKAKPEDEAKTKAKEAEEQKLKDKEEAQKAIKEAEDLESKAKEAKEESKKLKKKAEKAEEAEKAAQQADPGSKKAKKAADKAQDAKKAADQAEKAAKEAEELAKLSRDISDEAGAKVHEAEAKPMREKIAANDQEIKDLRAKQAKAKSKRQAAERKRFSNDPPTPEEADLLSKANQMSKEKRGRPLRREERTELLKDIRKSEVEAGYKSEADYESQIQKLGKENTQLYKDIQASELRWKPGQRGALPCFSADTVVRTASGARRIDQLKPGEPVLAYDFERAETVERTVLQVFKNKTLHFYDINLGRNVIHATGRHRFWVESESTWVEAKDLKSGMRLRMFDCADVAVDSIQLREDLEADTYNLSIEGLSNYFVGPGVLAHNQGRTHLDLGGDFVIYRGTYTGTNPKYKDWVYIGQTTEEDARGGSRGAAERQGEHRKNALKKLEEHKQGKIKLSPEEVEFYTFMKEVELKELVTGIKTQAQADYLEQKNIEIERKLSGDTNVRNRREQISSKSHMDEVMKEILNDPDVQRLYCPKT